MVQVKTGLLKSKIPSELKPQIKHILPKQEEVYTIDNSNSSYQLGMEYRGDIKASLGEMAESMIKFDIFAKSSPKLT